jgi:hypothetical protein
MVNDVGSLANFDGTVLTPTDIGKLQRSDAIALVNWSANRAGNRLARRVFSLKGYEGRLKFLDPADLTGTEGRLSRLKKVFEEGLIDVVSLNENETRILARTISHHKLPYNYRSRDVIGTAARLQESLNATVDIHTPIGSASAGPGGEAWAPAAGRVSGFVTGAGDVWDAGDLIGHLVEMPTRARLKFANACAYLYLVSERERFPSLRDVTNFLLRKEPSLK